MTLNELVDKILRSSYGSIFKREYELCHNSFGQRMVPHDRQVHLKPVILPLTTSILLLWLCAISLPSKGVFPVSFRLLVLPYLLVNSFDIAVNKSYSLGSPLRDVIFPFWGCIIAFRIIDIALVTLWDQDPAPKWIKPQLISNSEENGPKLPNFEPSENDRKSLASSDQDNFKVTRTPTYIWKPIPHPPLFSFDRALYGLDVIILNTPGTPCLFPWRLRSLDWSLSALNGQRREPLEFGKPEWPLSLALIQQAFHLLAHGYIRMMNLDGEKGLVRELWLLELSHQILVTVALGCIITLSSSLEEAIMFPLLLKSKLLPPTAILANTRGVILSKGLVDLWGYRWHHNWRRRFVRTARLFPGGLTATGNALWTFFLSGIMHSIMLARTYSTPTWSRPCSIIPIFWEPGMMFFFMAQGVGTLIEKRFFPPQGFPVLRRIWMYVILIGTGRYLANSMLVKGWLSAYEWNQTNYWNVISDLFR